MSTAVPPNPTSVLASLSLPGEALEALRTQGFVSPEKRGSSTRFKLRYRLHGQQRVKTLGTCPDRARRLTQELHDWQSVRRWGRAARRCGREASRVLRCLSDQIAPALRAAGFCLHGLQIRRPRAGPRTGSTCQTPNSVGLNNSSCSQRNALMDTEHSTNDGMTDYTPEGGQSARQRQKMQRVLNYQSSSLAKDDPLESVIGIANSGVMQLGLQLDDILTAAIAANPSVENVVTLGRVMDSYLRTLRQIDRFSQFEERLAARDRKSPRAAGAR